MAEPIRQTVEDSFTLVPQDFRCPELGCGAAWTGETFRRRATTTPQDKRCDACAEKTRDQERRRENEARNRQRRAEALADLGVPPLYRDATLETFALHGEEAAKRTQQRCLNVARRWVAMWPEVPALQAWAGGPGTGKGHLLWATARELAGGRGVGVRVVKLADLIRELRASWRDPAQPSEDAVLRAYRGVDLLAIDEVSAHAFRGEPKQHLYDVVDHRLEHGRPTILTTNEAADQLATLLGPALVSRVNGAGGVIDFGTRDYRSRTR